MNKPIIWMFSGQGSQYYRMGKDLYEGDRVFRQVMDYCSDLAEPLIGRRLTDVIFQERSAPFDRTLYTHPAIFSIQYSLAQMLRERNWNPHYVLGYSLGEVVAHVIAGAIAVEPALAMVIKQAELMEARCVPGAMIALLESRDLLRDEPEIFDEATVAAHNCSKHITLAGAPQTVRRIENYLNARGLSCVLLPVRYAFHSHFMDILEDEFKAHFGQLSIARSQTPIFSSTEARLVDAVPPMFFWEVTRKLVRFQDTIAMIEARGPARYIDLGPSGTLGTFVKYNLPAASASEFGMILTPFAPAETQLKRLDAWLAAGP